MVADLVREGAIAHPAIERAFRTVLRHRFLPRVDLDQAHRDAAVATQRGPDGVPVSSSSQPAIMARMLRQLEVRPGHRVLDPSGSGLAVVVSHPGAAEEIHGFGRGDEARRRLLQLVHAGAPVEIEHLTISAIPTGERLPRARTLATLARPNFSFVIGTAPPGGSGGSTNGSPARPRATDRSGGRIRQTT